MTAEVLEATGGKRLQGSEDLRFSGVSIDSRKIRTGDLFVALRGDRFDGHDFAEEVLKKGASGLVVKEGWTPAQKSLLHDSAEGRNLISVQDTLRALQNLAHAYRTRFSIPLIAVTGTNGKTSAKEMIYAILRTDYTAYRSPGNLNNHIGVPLSLLGLTSETEAAVLEFGMSGAGEIQRLREIASPTVVVITNVSAAHLLTLGTVDEVAEAKSEILDDLPEGGWAVLNRDDPRVYKLRERVEGKVITFGLHDEADLSAKDIASGPEGTRFTLTHRGEGVKVHLKMPGLHQVSNALAAAAAARVLEVSMSTIALGLSSYKPLGLRWETFTLNGGAVVINDAYNANPESMKAALQTVSGLGEGRRNIAVLGDMLELGDLSEAAHKEIGRQVADSAFGLLLAVGGEARRIAEEAERNGLDPSRIHCCTTWEAAAQQLQEVLQADDRILLKASRSMGLERIADDLRKKGV